MTKNYCMENVIKIKIRPLVVLANCPVVKRALFSVDSEHLISDRDKSNIIAIVYSY